MFVWFLGVLSPFISLCIFYFPLSLFVSLCLPLSPFISLYLPLSSFISLYLPSCGRPLPSSWTSCLPLSSFMWGAFAGFLSVLSLLSPFVSLHVGGLCQIPERLVSSYLFLSPFVWVVFSGFLSILFLFIFYGLPLSLLMWAVFATFCLPLVSYFPLSPYSFMWMIFVGFLGDLFDFVSLCLPHMMGFSGSWMFHLPLSPFISFHMGGLCRILGHIVVLYLSLSPFIYFHVGDLCRVPEYLISLCLPAHGIPGYLIFLCLPLSPFMWATFARILNFCHPLIPFVSHCLCS